MPDRQLGATHFGDKETTMVKELYDPHMFNYMWESLDQDRFVVGTYYIEDTREFTIS